MPRFERVKYTGDGTQYLLGLPTTDLDADEWYALPAETRENALRLGLYEGVSAARTTRRTERSEEPAPDDVTTIEAAPLPAEGEG